MLMDLQRVSADTSIDGIAGIIESYGCVVIERLAPDLVARARDELDAHIEAAPFGVGNFHGDFAKNVEGLVGKSDAAHNLIIHDTVMAVCDRHPCPTTIVATMWAGTDVTAENGATNLVPGSHRWEHGRLARADEVVKAAMPAGSVLIYVGALIHGGRAKTLPDKLARLVGYGFGGPFTGFVHSDDPHRLIEDTPLSERCHTDPELNEAAARLQRFRWGDIEAVPNSAGVEGRRRASLQLRRGHELNGPDRCSISTSTRPTPRMRRCMPP